jgi:hypothetical protein
MKDVAALEVFESLAKIDWEMGGQCCFGRIVGLMDSPRRK